MERNLTCCFTGHRSIPRENYNYLYNNVKNIILNLHLKNGVKYFCSGGAVGFDTLAARAVLELRRQYDIYLILFIPCASQSLYWSDRDKAVYDEILKRSDKKIYVSKNEYTPKCMLDRNRAMVDSSAYCVSYQTRSYGGTAYTVNYAYKNGVKVIRA